MLTKTTEIGVRTLLYLGVHSDETPLSPRTLAQALEESPTYLSKVAGLLTKAGIVRSHRGAAGGMELNRPPEEIRLLDIVQACQGVLLPDYCSEQPTEGGVCSFHQAMTELHQSTLEVLSRWTLENLLVRTCPEEGATGQANCKIGIVRILATPIKR